MPPLKLRRTPCTGNAVFFCASIPKFCLATWWTSAAKLHNPCGLLERLLIDIMPVQQTLVPCPAFHSRVVREKPCLQALTPEQPQTRRRPSIFWSSAAHRSSMFNHCTLPVKLPNLCCRFGSCIHADSIFDCLPRQQPKKKHIDNCVFYNAAPKVVFAASFLHARSLWRFAARSCKDPSSAMLQQTYGNFAARWLAAVFFFRAAAGGSALAICRMLSRCKGPICFPRTLLLPYWVYGPCSDAVFLHVRLCLLVVPSAFTSCLAWCSWSLNPRSANKSPVLAASSSLPSVSSLACCPKMHLSIFNALVKRLG